MATIDNKKVIDDLITSNGYYEDDPRAAMIVQYINAFGRITWGVTWENEDFTRQVRYMEETPYVKSPRVIWSSNESPK
jgi:hypothetical protein